jgi:NADH:ubiquinone reductase (H+-translocating)
MKERRHRVVVVGGGFGGVNATRALAKADVDVTVVDRTNHHLFQPLLYQVAAGILAEGLVAPALRSVIKKQANARALLAEVTNLDLDTKVVHAVAPDGRRLELAYDTLVVAGGATHSYFGRDEFAEFAPGMKTLEDACPGSSADVVSGTGSCVGSRASKSHSRAPPPSEGLRRSLSR